eukprot:CAMPEP_0195038522 /NCGR_PEP_ID=MMETSP0326_2-20130528/77598_1 /TAXON_ID=2866 ORGANISM="Crypthecodinium cohnii, Strain Seligo" /NCGR_SAMPLE_ID=MMETSP0326_2 /ASSEMBLY_ACC=CAM_ASM_000348 /LENGTH=85 /DNA_ID=CAMNT_0040064999 /DNA_START=211 /DNA_END=465 /DNA_ORIENTATION=-
MDASQAFDLERCQLLLFASRQVFHKVVAERAKIEGEDHSRDQNHAHHIHACEEIVAKAIVVSVLDFTIGPCFLRDDSVYGRDRSE